MKKCPFCAEEIKEEAVKCRFCGEFLNKRKYPRQERSRSCFLGCLIFICIIIVFVFIFIEFILPKTYTFLMEKYREILELSNNGQKFQDFHKELIEKLRDFFDSKKLMKFENK